MPDLIEHSYRRGLEVYLSTNAVLLFRYYDRIKDFITCLGMPLDGSTEEMNIKMTRGPDQFSATSIALSYFSENKPKHRVKVGTVVSQVNLHDLQNIGDYLLDNIEIYPPDTWRLYQFTPLGDGVNSRNIHEITNESFKSLCNLLIKRFPSRDISPLSNEDSNDSYIFISPVQEIQVLSDDLYVPVGNLKTISLEELFKIKEKFLSVIDKGSFNRRWLDGK